MIELSEKTIHRSCRLIRDAFPSLFILSIFKEITGDDNLDKFEEIKISGEKIKTNPDLRLSLKATAEIRDYFYENQHLDEEHYSFLFFIKHIAIQCLENRVLNRYSLDSFVSTINPLLMEDSNIRIENFEIHKLIPYNEVEDPIDVPQIFLNINIPYHVEDYFSEALRCIRYELYRSSILFCTFTLEASLRQKFFEHYGTTLIGTGKRKKEITFFKLTEWAIEEKIIEVIYAEKENLEFIRRYRNDLVHFDFTKKEKHPQLDPTYAKGTAIIIIHLVAKFINEIFYES